MERGQERLGDTHQQRLTTGVRAFIEVGQRLEHGVLERPESRLISRTRSA
jgi:hypothetical protein